MLFFSNWKALHKYLEFTLFLISCLHSCHIYVILYFLQGMRFRWSVLQNHLSKQLLQDSLHEAINQSIQNWFRINQCSKFHLQLLYSNLSFFYMILTFTDYVFEWNYLVKINSFTVTFSLSHFILCYYSCRQALIMIHVLHPLPLDQYTINVSFCLNNFLSEKPYQ